MKAPKESALYPVILQYLKLRGVLAWRVNSGARAEPATATHKRRFIRFGAPGMSDVIGILPGGRFIGVEIKRPGGKLTDAQGAFLDAVNRAGGLGFVATSVADVQIALDLDENRWD